MATQAIKTRLIGIQSLSVYIHNPLDADASKINNSEYHATIKASVRISEKKQTVGIILKVNLKSRGDIIPDNESSQEALPTDKQPSISYEGMATFEFNEGSKQGEGLRIEKDEESGGFKLPLTLMTKLADITYSTFRGIIYSKAEGTALKDISVPMLSPEQYSAIMSPKRTAITEID